jgi:hypothetical protein
VGIAAECSIGTPFVTSLVIDLDDHPIAFSLFGEVYISDDAGDSWEKIAREFGEIRAAAWLPN